jgi:hypothetical protein
MTMCGLSSKQMTRGGDYEEDDELTSIWWGKDREKKFEFKKNHIWKGFMDDVSNY